MVRRVTTFKERTLVIVKPDGVQRGLIGEIISRFEKVGVKMVACKMVWPEPKQAEDHYSVGGKEWLLAVGEKSIDSYKKQGIEIKESPLDIGLRVKRNLVEYLVSGPVVVMVWEGDNAIAIVRKIVGNTEPLSAEMGSIRGDLALDTYRLSDVEERPIRNLVHASGNKEEAEKEIKIWFNDNEIMTYTLIIEKILYGPHYTERSIY